MGDFEFQSLSKATVDTFGLSNQKEPPKLLKALTQPLTKKVIQIDKKVLNGWSLNKPEYANVTSLLKLACERNETETVAFPLNSNQLAFLTFATTFCDF